MIWALDFDDFNNICGYGKYPISRVMTNTLLASESGVSITPPSTHIPLSTVGTTTRSPYPPPTGDGGKTPDSGGGGSGHDGITNTGVLLSWYTPFVAMFCYIFRILCPIL